MSTNIQIAIVGGGCFWCTETIFNAVQGVIEVISGYSGGTVPGHPTYREITSGLTGHAEVVQISYDANTISYKELLEIFMTTHDPTTLNRQGADVGTQYRSVIFYQTEQEREIAQTVLEHMQQLYDDRIHTELTHFEKFYKADDNHQDFYNRNKEQPYCTYVINPKLKTLKQLHANKLKS